MYVSERERQKTMIKSVLVIMHAFTPFGSKLYNSNTYHCNPEIDKYHLPNS